MVIGISKFDFCFRSINVGIVYLIIKLYYIFIFVFVLEVKVIVFFIGVIFLYVMG